MLGLGDGGSSCLGHQLIDRIEKQRLNACAIPHVSGANESLGFGDHSIGTAIAIHPGFVDDLTVAIDEPVVDTPGVNGNAHDVVAKSFACLGESVLNVLKKSRRFPMPSIRVLNSIIREAVDFLENDRGSIKVASHHTTAGGSKIDG